jgi:HPr kinase/phosphorylase
MKVIEHSPVHGTAVAVGGRGFLILGGSGSGKSGLALQMMALGADLVSDDQVRLERINDSVELSAPETLVDMIEARFVGILKVSSVSKAALHHVIDLDAEPKARLPQLQVCDVLGVRIDLINGRNVPNLTSILMILGRSERHS